MSVSGIALVLFLTFHAAMNVVALFSGEAYNAICELLGANWYAVAATAALAALVAIHFLYAIVLTLQNRRARGASGYALTQKPCKVEWASQNMFVLGAIVVLGLLLHLWNFWYHMMFAELIGAHDAAALSPVDGYGYILRTFSCPVYAALYIVWLVALWFHLTHGFWSALQTLGLSSKVWFARWKCIGQAYATLLVLAFMVVVVLFALGLNCGGCCEEIVKCCVK